MDNIILKQLLRLANKSSNTDDFPVGALVVKNNKVVSAGYNKRNKTNLTIDHAEIIAIRKANKILNNWRLTGCKLLVTLEPCEMCKMVISESRIDEVVYLVDRMPQKKQYKGTKIKKMSNNMSEELKIEISKYESDISTFFIDKR